MSFKIRKIKMDSVILCIFIALYVYFIGFFITYFKVPESTLYVSDILLTILFLLNIKKLYKTLFMADLIKLTGIMTFLVICGTFSLVANGGSFLRWIWALRNWGRFFLYFTIGISVLTQKELEKFYNFTLKLFHINTIIIILQFLFMRNVMSQDQMNGLVGRNISGANIILILSATAIVIAEYFSKHKKLKNTLIVFCEGLLVSILVELKAVIFFIFIIFFFVMFVNLKLTEKQIKRLIFFVAVTIVLMIIAINMIAKVYPRFANILTFKGICEEIANPHGYGYSGKIDRLTAIKVINEDFFNQGSLFTKFFGLGIGNAEYSLFDFLISDFYRQNGTSYSYLNFTSSMIYLETGYIGLTLFIIAILLLLLNALKHLKDCNNLSDSYMFNIGIAELLIILIFIIYNNLQRTDMSLLLAIYSMAPWVAIKDKKKRINNEKNTSVTDGVTY